MSVLVAAALDAGLAEPAARAHPVVWAGGYLDTVGRRLPAGPPGRAALSGALAWAAGAGVAAAAGVVVDRVAARLPGGAALRGLALWPLLSARMLVTEVAAIGTAVEQDVDAGRLALARVVSRDTTELDPAEVRAAAVESLAENLSDSVVAPLFWFLLGGLPGAAVYRFANTADASWGYRTTRWRDAGRTAAIADDVLNVWPARLTALLLHGPRRWAELGREAAKSDSPNAGWPMAAMARRRRLRLTKRGHYDLNPAGADPTPGDLRLALRDATTAALVAVALAALADHLTAQGARR